MTQPVERVQVKPRNKRRRKGILAHVYRLDHDTFSYLEYHRSTGKLTWLDLCRIVTSKEAMGRAVFPAFKDYHSLERPWRERARRTPYPVSPVHADGSRVPPRLHATVASGAYKDAPTDTKALEKALRALPYKIVNEIIAKTLHGAWDKTDAWEYLLRNKDIPADATYDNFKRLFGDIHTWDTYRDTSARLNYGLFGYVREVNH